MWERDPSKNGKSGLPPIGWVTVVILLLLAYKGVAWVVSAIREKPKTPSIVKSESPSHLGPTLASKLRPTAATQPVPPPVLARASSPVSSAVKPSPELNPAESSELARARSTIKIAQEEYGMNWHTKVDLDEVRKHAEGGSREAMLQLGQCFAMGERTIKDEVESARWYQMAIDNHNRELEMLGFAGHIDSMTVLVKRHATGRCAPKDARIAEAWVMLAANEAPADRLVEIARHYEQQSGMSPHSRKIALKIMTAAALAGDDEAQFLAGSRFEEASTEWTDVTEAYAWYNVAAAKGLAAAKARRADLEKRTDGLAIAEQGQRRARSILLEMDEAAKRIRDKTGVREIYRKLIEDIKAGKK